MNDHIEINHIIPLTATISPLHKVLTDGECLKKHSKFNYCVKDTKSMELLIDKSAPSDKYAACHMCGQLSMYNLQIGVHTTTNHNLPKAQ